MPLHDVIAIYEADGTLSGLLVPGPGHIPDLKDPAYNPSGGAHALVARNVYDGLPPPHNIDGFAIHHDLNKIAHPQIHANNPKVGAALKAKIDAHEIHIAKVREAK